MLTEGIINIDKPAEWTSHDVVAKIRSLLGHAKRQAGEEGKLRVGHTGTLDPMATGVLPICFGAATKISALLMNSEKEYDAVLQLGQETDTEDATGTVLRSTPVPAFSLEQLAETFHSFVGTVMQRPPIYSAVKVNGAPLYQSARKGVVVERAARPITIKAIQITKVAGSQIFFNVVCSKGTYIRTLCADIGARLGVGGHMGALRRVRAGIFSIADAVPLDRFIEQFFKGGWEDAVYSLEEISTFLPDIVKERCYV